jgi:hypothetical protein
MTPVAMMFDALPDRHAQTRGDVEATLSLPALACLLTPGPLTSRASANLGRVASVRHERRKDMLHVINQAEGIPNV